MKLTKRSDGRYTTAVSLGRGKRKYVYGTNPDDVKRKAVAVLSAHYEGKTITTAKGSVGAFLDRWIKHLQAEGRLRPRTLAGYEQYVELYLKPGLGSVPLAKLTAADVAEFLAARKARPRDGRKGRTAEKLSPLTMRHCHAILRRALKQAMRWELIAKNPASADFIDAPRVQRKEARYLGAAEARKLLGVLKEDRLGALFLVMIATGLRPSEAYGLTWARVDLDAAVLHIREGLERDRETRRWFLGELKTEKSRRDLPLPAPAVGALREYRLQQNEEKMAFRKEWRDAPLPDLVFTTRGGNPLDDAHVRRTFRELLEVAGVPHATPYALRHSWASLALLQGVPLRVVAEGLGHTGVTLAATTYAHVAPELQRDAADRIGKVLLGED
ncbi:tyrosine-type recombinase/integrase [Vulgatibacter sp.]|uniref:tyrosine-type recombinase/integrase n=1 Tax=Vulgatibacter sp. TaxID=1971226 RepID=UPI00356364B7